MIIAEIKPDKNHLVKITGEDGKCFLVDKDLCIELCLRKGDELSEEKIEEILKKSEYERAKNRALWHLDRASYTRRALYDKLRRAGFGEQAANAALDRLCELDVINDRRYALYFAERLSASSYSKAAAREKLYQKGVPRDIIAEALESTEFDEGSAIAELINKKYAQKIASGQTDKVYTALVRKGFSYGEVKKALKEYIEEDF